MRVIPEHGERGPLVLVLAPGVHQNVVHEYAPDEARAFAHKLLAAANAAENVLARLKPLETT
jgi:hypothetical protein